MITNSLAGILVGAVSIRRVRLVHRFPFLRHCIVVRLVRIVAVVIQALRVHHRTAAGIIRHFRSANVVRMMPTANHLPIFLTRFRWVLYLRWHDTIRRRLHNIVVFRRAVVSFVLMNNCGHRRCWSGAWCCYSNGCRRWRWELRWAFRIMTWNESRGLLEIRSSWLIKLTIAGHSVILIACILTTTFRRRRWWFVLVAGRWTRARWVRRCVRRWFLIMLIICTRWDFIYTFAATRTVFAVLILILLFVLRRRRGAWWCAPARRDSVGGHIRATRVRNLCAGRRAFRRAAAAARLFLLAVGRWGGCDRRSRQRIYGSTGWWTRRLMRNFRILFRWRRRIARVRLVIDWLVGWNRFHVAALFLKVANNIISENVCATLHLPICYNDVGSSHSTWHCPSNSRLLRRANPAVEHTSRETAVYSRSYYIACRHLLLPSNLFQLLHRCNMLKRKEDSLASALQILN